MRFLTLFFSAAAIAAAVSVAADEPAPITAIQDNSFLIEEAYNQEFGVVQHISTFQRLHDQWAYTFTQEWPAPGIRHQLSYTVPVTDTGTESGLGDVALNYRYQLMGSGETKLAIAPRLSVYLPTGDTSRGLGSGKASLEVNLPVSYVISDHVSSHSNVGAFRDGATKETTLTLGQSVIYALNHRVHLMLESRWAHTGGETENDDVVVSPGVRWAYNLAGGLQIVPGVAFPRTVGDGAGEQSTFFYISFEHPFRKTN